MGTQSEVAPPHDLHIPDKPNPNEIFPEKYNYKKGKRALYNQHFQLSDEKQIIARLNELIAENESEGLNADEMDEMDRLYRKLK